MTTQIDPDRKATESTLGRAREALAALVARAGELRRRLEGFPDAQTDGAFGVAVIVAAQAAELSLAGEALEANAARLRREHRCFGAQTPAPGPETRPTGGRMRLPLRRF